MHESPESTILDEAVDEQRKSLFYVDNNIEREIHNRLEFDDFICLTFLIRRLRYM